VYIYIPVLCQLEPRNAKDASISAVDVETLVLPPVVIGMALYPSSEGLNLYHSRYRSGRREIVMVRGSENSLDLTDSHYYH
jgi:hypothetical protein